MRPTATHVLQLHQFAMYNGEVACYAVTGDTEVHVVKLSADKDVITLTLPRLSAPSRNPRMRHCTQLRSVGVRVLPPKEQEKWRERQRMRLVRLTVRAKAQWKEEQEAARIREGTPCQHCGAMLFEGENRGMCCSHGKFVLDMPPLPPELEEFLCTPIG
jgi:hypothetical protein